MSRWHKPDPPDMLFPSEPDRPYGMSYREFAALQKWRHGHTLKPEDVEGLGLSPNAMILQPRQAPSVLHKKDIRFFVNQIKQRLLHAIKLSQLIRETKHSRGKKNNEPVA
jgi:hypothetical protein